MLAVFFADAKAGWGFHEIGICRGYPNPLIENKHSEAALISGVATLQTSALSVGQHYIAAEYLGEGVYKYIPAVVLRVWVGRIPVTVAVASSTNLAMLGSPVAFSATLAGTLADKLATGHIDFFVDNVFLGTSALSGNTATFTTSTLPHGILTITA